MRICTPLQTYPSFRQTKNVKWSYDNYHLTFLKWWFSKILTTVHYAWLVSLGNTVSKPGDYKDGVLLPRITARSDSINFCNQSANRFGNEQDKEYSQWQEVFDYLNLVIVLLQKYSNLLLALNKNIPELHMPCILDILNQTTARCTHSNIALMMKWHDIIKILVLNPKYSGIAMPIPWLLMSWWDCY